ncbi:MAG: 16S rRNA (guanine(966)-N(2))-methyltransferase RsmD [candidate division Zixibacteria bacterium]|nr:16S rRNA (guanine(966)-N(2))-methyltransferase RsmD [candidate division Zixibacteria bacterium]
MRITGGTFRGRQLKTTPGMTTRPTADKIRQAVFNILMNDIAEAQVLDLFAGSGAMGIEAISHGAQSAVFVEAGRAQVNVIRKNLDALGLKAEVIAGDYTSACRALEGAGRRFDLIFADPPYKEYVPLEIIDTILQYNLLAPGGLLIIEHKSGQETATERLWLIKQRRFGQTEVSFYGEKNQRPE